MNSFGFPKSVCNGIGNINRDFFQSNNKTDSNCNGHHPVKTVPWDKISRPKYEGSLGIKKTEDLNATYVAK